MARECIPKIRWFLADNDEISSTRGNPPRSEEDQSQYTFSIGPSSMLSYGSETTASTNDSWRTPSTDRHGQTYTLVAPSEFNFPTTKTLKCLFWFTGCSEIFNDTPGEWYPHIMDHLAPYERETLEHGPLECSLCGAAFDTWYLVFSHAFNHIRRGDRQPGMSDANMVEYLAEQSIITPEQKRVALEPRRRAAPRMGYYDTRRSRNLYPNQMGYPGEHSVNNQTNSVSNRTG